MCIIEIVINRDFQKCHCLVCISKIRTVCLNYLIVYHMKYICLPKVDFVYDKYIQMSAQVCLSRFEVWRKWLTYVCKIALRTYFKLDYARIARWGIVITFCLGSVRRASSTFELVNTTGYNLHPTFMKLYQNIHLHHILAIWGHKQGH